MAVYRRPRSLKVQGTHVTDHVARTDASFITGAVPEKPCSFTTRDDGELRRVPARAQTHRWLPAVAGIPPSPMRREFVHRIHFEGLCPF